jgi:cytidylate kinase
MASFVVAIDGPAASGKGTLARRLAERFGLAHLDTGKLYRATALLVLEAKADPADPRSAAAAARRIEAALLDDPRLDEERVARAASVVAAIPEVREALLHYQRAFAAQQPGAVLDGRDVGTVIAPAADVKLYVTASPKVRAARRVAELKARGIEVDAQEVLSDLLRRDERDSQRQTAPLKPAPDAHLLDTTHLDIDAAFRAAVAIIEAVRTGRKRD